MENTIKIFATSDFHGHLPNIKEEFDLLLICGDICPTRNQNITRQERWVRYSFIPWVNSLPFRDINSKVVMTWGNHDFCGHVMEQKDIDHLTDHLVILKNGNYDFEYAASDGIGYLSIAGTPYCKIFGGWAFMLPNETLRMKYDELKPCDILISHDSPDLNDLGTISEGWNSNFNAGNVVLADYIRKTRPKYFFSGHIHSGNHIFSDVDGTMCANVSLLNENYNPVFPILSFDMDKDSKAMVGKVQDYFVDDFKTY